MSLVGIHSKPIDGAVLNGHVPQPAPEPLRWRPDGDTAIRFLAAAVVLAVAAFAAIVSYSHIFELGRHHGQDGTAARLLPLSVDGLIASASLVMLYAARNRIALRRVSWPRVMLWLGIAATVAANVFYGLPFGMLGAVISAWPAVAFVGSVEMAVRFARDTRGDDSRDAPAVTAVTAPAVTRPRGKAPRQLSRKRAEEMAAEQGVSVSTIYRRNRKTRSTP